MTQNGDALRFVSEWFQNDKQVVLSAVTQSIDAFLYASKELKNDKEVVLASVTQVGWALEHSSEELKNNKEVVLAAVTDYGWALQYASKELQNDVEVVLAAVTQHGVAFDFTSKALQDNAEVVQAALMSLLIKKYNTIPDGDTAANEEVVLLIHHLVSKQVLVPSDVIHVASSHGLHWDHGMSTLIERDYEVLESKDEVTGLLPFMTFASSSSADLNTLFEIMKKHPESVRLYNTPIRKRDNEMTTDESYDGNKLRKLN